MNEFSPFSGDSERNPRAHELWRPSYDFISLTDLFMTGGEILEPQIAFHDAIVESLKPMEEHLLDVFNFYARLKRTR